MNITRTLTVALLTVAFATGAAADVTITLKAQSSSSGMGKQKQEQGTDTIYIKSDRFASVSHKGSRSIIRLDKKVLWVLTEKTKTYTEKTFEQLQADQDKAAKQMEQAAKQYESMLANPNIPEATKKNMRDAMAQMKPKYTVEKKGTAKVAGYECDHYVISNHGKKVFDIWATTAIKGAEKYNEAMTKVFAYGKMAEAFKQVKGVWLKHAFEMKNQYMSVKNSAEATSVSTDAVDDKRFEIPEGYTKK